MDSIRELSRAVGFVSTFSLPRHTGQTDAGLREKTSVAEPPLGNFWPSIRRDILASKEEGPKQATKDVDATITDDKETQPKPDIRAACPICFRELPIGRSPSSDWYADNDADTKSIITPCGHMFCRSCLRQSLKSQRGTGVRTCPMCRHQLSCARCGRICSLCSSQGPQAADSAHVGASPAQVAANLPRTVPEGGRFDAICRRCFARSRWMERISRGVWPERAQTIELGVVEFVYSILDELETAKMPATKGEVLKVFEKVLDDEFEFLEESRDAWMDQEIRSMGENEGMVWF